MNSYELLAKLISFDTTSHKSNLPLIHFVNDLFAHFNITTKIIKDESGQKANLLATLPAHDNQTQGGLILSGHTDVVPVDGQKWDTDPFVALQADDRIYGRGATDMKGFIAVVLSLIPTFKKMKLKKPLHFAFSYDEEVGCLGAHHIINDYLQNKINPEACIVGEPTSMRVVVGHKGVSGYRCRVHGLAKHSSLTHEGCNAIDYASELIIFLQQLANHNRDKGPYDNGFNVPYSTISTNLIKGGIAGNIVPELCEFFFDYRNLPTVDPKQLVTQIKKHIDEHILPKMQKVYSTAKIELEATPSIPGLKNLDHDAFTQLLYTITQDKTVYKVAYGSEAGLFQQAGIATIICGPGNIEQAHIANEYIKCEQLDKCEKFLLKVSQKYLSD